LELHLGNQTGLKENGIGNVKIISSFDLTVLPLDYKESFVHYPSFMFQIYLPFLL
jgi:hypothetical protein